MHFSKFFTAYQEKNAVSAHPEQPLFVDFACSPHVCVDVGQVLWFPLQSKTYILGLGQSSALGQALTKVLIESQGAAPWLSTAPEDYGLNARSRFHCISMCKVHAHNTTTAT